VLTRKLFVKCKQDGVQQFIYVSSTKVYGDDIQTELDENSPCNPIDAYGKSKLMAEQFLLSQKDCNVAIVRPPLIYGSGVKGNMKKIMELCNSSKPLPFDKINNKRSMVFVDNLIELINTIILQKSKGIFIAGDKAPISTTFLVKEIKSNLNKKNNTFAIPFFFRSILKKAKPNLYIRLFGDFEVSNKNTNKKLNFIPKYETSYGIKQMVKGFKNK
jgi:nucleoside-diphosphate-sugar epimerase